MQASEISRWEKRIKSQGKKVIKKEGPPKETQGSPHNKETRRAKTKQETEKHSADIIQHSCTTVKPKIDRSKFSNPAGARYKTKENKGVHPSKIVTQYINAWNTSMFPKLREFSSGKDQAAGKQTKVYKETIRLLKKLINGTLYNGSEPEVRFPDNLQRGPLKIPIERFQYLIRNLEKKAFNSDYKPLSKTYLTKTTLAHFLAGNGRYGSMASRLLDYALTPAIPNTHTKPKDPKLAEVFKELFLFKAERKEASLTFAERNHLVGASNKYLDFFTHFRGAFEVYGYKDPIDFLDEYYWKAISDSWPGRRIRKVSLGYLNSRALVDKVIVPYFLKIGMLKTYDFEGITVGFWR